MRDEMEEFFPPVLEVLETLRELLVGRRRGKREQQVTGNKEDTPGRASLERPRTREPTTMP